MTLDLYWAPLEYGAAWAATLMLIGLHLRQLGASSGKPTRAVSLSEGVAARAASDPLGRHLGREGAGQFGLLRRTLDELDLVIARIQFAAVHDHDRVVAQAPPERGRGPWLSSQGSSRRV